MPTDYGFRLEDLQGIQDFGRQSVKTDEHQAIHICQNDPFGGFMPQDIELVPKDDDLGLQGSLRPEQSDHEIPDQPAEIAHGDDYQPIRRRSSAVLGLR
jgi:hypothetical protein